MDRGSVRPALRTRAPRRDTLLACSSPPHPPGCMLGNERKLVQNGSGNSAPIWVAICVPEGACWGNHRQRPLRQATVAESPIALPPEQGGQPTNFTPTRMNASSGLTRLRPTEGRREQFLSLARVWTHAAFAEGGRDDSDRSEIQPRENPAGRGSRRGLNWLGRFGGLGSVLPSYFLKSAPRRRPWSSHSPCRPGHRSIILGRPRGFWPVLDRLLLVLSFYRLERGADLGQRMPTRPSPRALASWFSRNQPRRCRLKKSPA